MAAIKFGGKFSANWLKPAEIGYLNAQNYHYTDTDTLYTKTKNNMRIKVLPDECQETSIRRGPGSTYEQQNYPIITIIPAQFKDDVQALCSYAGIEKLSPGMVINMSLQEISTVVERARKRIDSYTSLIAFLHDELSVELILTSKKQKNYGEKILQ
jgi:hypothetical protein